MVGKMTKKNIIFISMLVLFIVSIGMVSAADDLSQQISDDVSIDSSQDVLSVESDLENSDLENSDAEEIAAESNSEPNLNAEIEVENKTFDAIQNAIVQSSDNDTIILNGTYTSTGKNMIIVNKAVTFQGVNNAILDGNNFKTRFRIDVPNVIFKNICFKNFKFGDNETAIIITKNGITVDNCNFINNTGKITAIIANGGNCKVTNSKFSSNANDLGAIYLKNAKMDVSNCSFASNKYLSDKASHKMYIDDDILFSGLIISYKSKLTLSNTKLYGNKLCGLSIVKSNYSISNCVFNNSQSAIYSEDSNSSIKNSLFTKLKSGIHLYGGKNTINACNFTNNTGTALILDDDYDYYSGSYLINNSKFINNTNKNGASAIHAFTCTAKILNCNFKNNSGLNEEGVIFLETNSPVTITNGNKTLKFNGVTVLNNSLKAYPYFTYDIKKSFTTSYKSGKLFTGKVIYGFNKKTWSIFYGIAYMENGKKEYGEEFDSKIKIDFSKYPVGKYKVTFAVLPDGSEDFVWRNIYAVATVKITKAKTVVQAPKVTAKYKKSKYFKVTIKNKASNKAVSKVKVKIKVYTGNKYKTYTVKTNKKGIAKINTKKLKRGKHKVVISSGNKNYIISKNSSIRIK